MSANPIADHMLLSLSLMVEEADYPIIIRRSFVRFTGDIESAILLNSLLFWTPKTKVVKNGVRWIAKSDKELQIELCLKRSSVRSAVDNLIGMGILIKEIFRFDSAPTCHYRIDFDMLGKKWVEFIKSHVKSGENAIEEAIQSIEEAYIQLAEEDGTRADVYAWLEKQKPQVASTSKPISVDEYRSRVKNALSTAEKNAPQFDTSYYPESVKPYIDAIVRLWKISPPGRKDSKYSYWISTANELSSACAEFGISLIDDIYTYVVSTDGTSRFMVEGPGSLIKTARALAAEKRKSSESGSPDVSAMMG